jgi:hypothetical protein
MGLSISSEEYTTSIPSPNNKFENVQSFVSFETLSKINEQEDQLIISKERSESKKKCEYLSSLATSLNNYGRLTCGLIARNSHQELKSHQQSSLARIAAITSSARDIDEYVQIVEQQTYLLKGIARAANENFARLSSDQYSLPYQIGRKRARPTNRYFNQNTTPTQLTTTTETTYVNLLENITNHSIYKLITY